MYSFFDKLTKHSWWTPDTNLLLSFKEVKGLLTVTVSEYNKSVKSEKTYLLQYHTGSNTASFVTPNGQFTVGITDDGEELYLSPLGISLYDYYVAKRIYEDAVNINNEDSPQVINFD